MYCHTPHLNSSYYFSTSQSLNAGGLSKENSYQELYIRGISLKRGALGFLYFFEDLVVDGNSIDFIDAPDSADYGIMGNVNKVFVTKPFAITNNSNFSFTEFSGLADSTVAAQVLGPNGYVAYKVELVDNATNAVIGTIRNTTIKSSNAAASSVVPYVLNTSGVGSRIVVVRITHSSNLDSVNTGLMKGYATEKPTAGLAKASVNELILIELNVVATDYALDQNYPNPFNPATTISYQLPRDGRLSIKIFDVIGREVTTLVDEFKVSGRYAVKFDASHLDRADLFLLDQVWRLHCSKEDVIAQVSLISLCSRSPRQMMFRGFFIYQNANDAVIAIAHRFAYIYRELRTDTGEYLAV